MKSPFETLEPFDKENDFAQVIIDTPKGSRNKYKFDAKLGVFRLSHVLAAGIVFPFNFGFLPGTTGGDGDPLDVLVLTEEPIFAGCMIPTRLVGVIEADQTQDGQTNRNDRFLGVALASRLYGQMKTLADVGEKLVDEVEHFFVSYNEMRGRQFKPIGRYDADYARKMVEQSRA